MSGLVPLLGPKRTSVDDCQSVAIYEHTLATPGASAPALLTRVVLRSIPGGSRPETQYGWPSRPIQLKAFLIERDHAWTSSLA